MEQGLHFIGDHLKGPDPVGDHSADDADNYGRDIESSNKWEGASDSCFFVGFWPDSADK